MKKYVNNSFITKSPSEYKNGTAAVTNLPVTLYTDGEPISAYTLKGNTSVSGTPSPQNPVTISGVGNETANLFSTTWEQGTIDSTGANTSSDSCVRTKGYISVENGKTYSFKRTVFSGYMNLRFYDSNKQYIGGGANNITLITGSSEANPMGRDYNFCCFTINNSNIAYMRINDFSNDLTNQYMMCDGQYTSQTIPPYEPYGYEISILKDLQPLTPIYLNEPLLKIGTHYDSISDTTETREIAKIQVKDLPWSNYDLSGVNVFRTTETLDKLYGTGTSTMLCDSYTVVASRTSIVNGTIAPYNASTDNRIIVRDDNYSTYSEFKEAMGNTWIYFVKKTPTTESVTAPEITTTGGTVTLDVDTTIKPSEMSLTYHGWHEHEPLKRENGSWS